MKINCKIAKLKTENYQTGFTLIEVLVASLIFVVVITVATSVFVVNSTVGDKSRTIRELSQSARYGLESIAREARNSSKMSANGTSLTITSKDGTEKTYELSGDNIIINGDPTATLFPDRVIVDEWTVADIGEDPINYPLIQIEMQLSYNLGTGKKSETYKQTYRTSFTKRSYPVADFQAGN